MSSDTLYPLELTAISDLQPHPRNYRTHPPVQLEHLAESIREHGFYRNVVIAEDGTILAGHGIVQAAQAAGHEQVPTMRLPISPDDPKALKILTGDNELPLIAEDNDRQLADLLRDISANDTLLGTGYDDQMLALLVMTTRPEHEIKDLNAAAAWVGMPAFEGSAPPIQLVLTFENDADRDTLITQLGVVTTTRLRQTWSARWPPRGQDDLASLRFEAP